MNVLMVGVDNKRLGGMWTVAENYLNSKLFNEQVDLTYIATSTGGSVFKRLYIMFFGYLKILKVLCLKNIDIVHIHMAEKGSVYRKGLVIYIAKFFHKKVLVQMHAGPFIDWYNLQSSLNKNIISNILCKVDKFAILGEYWKIKLEQIIPSAKLVILYNGISVPNMNPYTLDGCYITYLGLLKKTKGIYDLIDAIELINDKLDPKIKLLLCGKDEEGDVHFYITKKNLQNRIVLMGWVDGIKKMDILKKTLICVLPSYFEALSMTVLESMCFGIPVITTDISTMPELLGNDIKRIEVGDCYSLGNTILDWTSNPEKRKKISNIEYFRAKKYFSIERCINSTIHIYKAILNEN